MTLWLCQLCRRSILLLLSKGTYDVSTFLDYLLLGYVDLLGKRQALLVGWFKDAIAVAGAHGYIV